MADIDTSADRPARRRHARLNQAWRISIALAALYGVVAYLALPAFWTHYEHQKDLARLPMLTRTAQDIPGDPINLGLVGDKTEVLCVMHAAGWYPADPVTLRSSLEIAGSVLFDRPYRDAPVSDLYYLGRREDLSFEKPAGASADRRHHVRFWKALEQGAENRPVWLGAVTFDRSVGISDYTGAITHHIAADIDAERLLLTHNLETAAMVQAKYQVTGIGPTLIGRNGGGDRYYTDGEVWMLRLVETCASRSDPVITLPSPVATEIKDGIWRGLARALKK